MRTPVKLPFWERVKKHIKTHKISQRNFAAYVGIPFGTFRDWLCYGMYPDIRSASNIAEALGVSLEYLIRGADGQAAERRGKDALKRKNAAAKIKKMVKIIEKNAEVIG